MHVSQMAPTAARIVNDLLRVREGERVTIVTDTEAAATVTDALAMAVAAARAVPVVVRMLPHEVGGQEPVAAVAAAMGASDVVIMQCSYGLVHTEAVRTAARNGARGVDMWGVTEEMMVRGALTADFEEVGRTTELVAQVLMRGRQARLTTREGTDLVIPLGGAAVSCRVGIADKPGEFYGLPNGEASMAPPPGGAEGVVVDPYMFERRDIAFRQEPFEMEVRGGQAVRFRGGREARLVEEMVKAAGDSARNIAEFAIGTNRWARLGVTLREGKKAWGTAHVALGDNKTIGGTVSSPLHMDMIFRSPTVVVEGEVIVQDGKLLVG